MFFELVYLQNRTFVESPENVANEGQRKWTGVIFNERRIAAVVY
jgi:hypothetical protein